MGLYKSEPMKYRNVSASATLALTIRTQTVNNSSINESVNMSIQHIRAIHYNLIKNAYAQLHVRNRNGKIVFLKVGRNSLKIKTG